MEKDLFYKILIEVYMAGYELRGYHSSTSCLYFLPDNTVQTADLLIGVGVLIFEDRVLVGGRPVLLHRDPSVFPVEGRRVFGPHRRRVSLYTLYWRKDRS